MKTNISKFARASLISFLLLTGSSHSSFAQQSVQTSVELSPATLVVTKTNDTEDGICDSDCSLREAVNAAASGDTIIFDPSLSGQTIMMSETIYTPISISGKDLVIDGSSLGINIKISGENTTIYPLYISSPAIVTLKNIDFINGSASNGGAIYNSGDLTISNSTFADNFASDTGGAIDNSGYLTITGSTFRGNVASNHGGAIYNLFSLTIKNSTFFNNSSSGNGGAVYDSSGEATILNSTFSDNNALLGGGIYYYSYGLSLKNTILAKSASGGDCYINTGTIVSYTNNLIETNGPPGHICGTPVSTADPLLDSLSYNGGPTQTMALLPGSPAIDLGDDGTCEPTDQRGITRPQEEHCDIGAYEMVVSSDGLFEPYVNYSIDSPHAVGLGDFNDDGKLDAAVTNADGELRIFVQDQSGGLGTPTIYPAGSRPESLAVGDLNHDGRADVVVTNFSDNTISVFIQGADGSMADRVTYATGSVPDAVAVGDVNADGLDDIAVSNWSSPFISVFIQNAGGTLNPKVDYTSPQAGNDDIAIGDVNGDGLNDVVKMNRQGFYPDLSVFLQNENGVLDTAVPYSLTDCDSYCGDGIGLGDVTGDGKTDVVMSYGGNIPTAKIAVFAQGGDGSLLPAVSYSGYHYPEPLEVADVNGDGLADVIVAHGGGNAVSVYAQHSNGVQGSYSLYPLRQNSASHFKPQALAIGDINNDGLPDVLVANYNYGLDILYHMNPSGSPPAVTSITRTDRNPTDVSTVGFLVTFTKSVTGVDGSDFDLTTTGTVSGASVLSVTGSNNSYHVTVDSGSGEGTIRLDVIPDDSIQDIYGNPLDGGYTSGEIYTTMEVLSDGLFEPYVNYSIDSPEAVGIGDFNNDGRFDAAVTNANGELRIFIQNLSGSLDSPAIYTAGSRPEALAVGDFNNDGRADVVLTNTSDNTISVFIQQANGSMADRVTYATGTGPNAVAVGDVNADGLVDIAVSNGSSPFISIFIQNAGGTLNQKVDYTSPQADEGDIAVGDVNGDGLNDVVKMKGVGYNPNLSVFLQNENGVLDTAVPYSLTDCESFCIGGGIGLGDVTADGKTDVVMSYGGNKPNAHIAVFAQGGNGSLLPDDSYSAYDIPEPLEVADVNQDGLADVIVAHGGWNAVSVYAQHGFGVLGSYTIYPLPQNSLSHFKPQALAVGDINNDGLPDILLADNNVGLDILYHINPYSLPPSVYSITRADRNPTDASTVGLLVTFTKSVSGVDVSDFDLTTTGTVYGASVLAVTGSNNSYQVTVDTGSGEGTIRLDLIDDHSIQDIYGNPLDGGYTGGETYIVLEGLSENLFEPYVSYPTDSLEAVGIGDFNNDGKLDAAVTSYDGELRVFLQNQSGRLDDSIFYATGARPEALAVGDLNHDGLDDIVTANFSDNTISVFIQGADGSIADQVTYATGLGPDSVAVGDVNADGLDDIAVSNWNSAYISIFIQNASGTLNPKVDYPSPQAGYDDIAIGDVNGDGLNDVVKMNGQGFNPDLSVFLQNENGVLDTAVSYYLTDCEYSCHGGGIGLGDITGDGKNDVVMSYGGNKPYAQIAVFEQGGEGTLLDAVSYSAYDNPEPLEVTDVNGDGLVDVIVAHLGDEVSAYAQHSNGVLGTYNLYPLPQRSDINGPQAFSIGDINNDGLPDVLVADNNHGLDILYHMNPSAPPPTVTSITRTDRNPTDASTVGFSVFFDKAVTGVDISDFALTTSGTVSDASVQSVTGSNNIYKITVDTGLGEGTIRLDLIDDDSIQDVYGSPLDGDFTGGETYTTFKMPSDGLFEPYINYPIESPYAVGVGDFNDDGRLDAAVTNANAELRIFIQDQFGGLGTPTIYPAGTRPESLAVGDLNHDGRDDIVVTNFSDNTISVFIQQSDGSMAGRVTYATGSGPDAIAVGDVNADGLDDIAVSNSNWDSTYFSIFIQNAGGTMNPKVDYTSPKAGNDDIAIGDVNGDGLNDVVKMNGQGQNPNLSVFLQNENGLLDSVVSYSRTDCESLCSGSGIGLGDVTGDGKTDVVMSYGGNKPDAQIAVFAQEVDGSLIHDVSYSAYDIPEPLQVADVNQDGLADVIVAHGGWNAVSVHAQHSIGVLGSYSLYPLKRYSTTHYKPQALAIGDINNDGLPDLLVANYSFGLDILYHMNPSGPPPAVTSITRTNTNPTNTSTVGFSVTFTKFVTGVDGSDFHLTTTGTISGASMSGLNSNRNIYNVYVNIGSGDGTIRLDVINDNSIQDVNGNSLDGDYTNGEIYDIDRTPPDTSIDAHPLDPSSDFSPTFEFSSPDDTATFVCQLDSGGYSSCSSPKTYIGLSNGTHTFEVRAVDPAHNIDPSPDSYTWTINAFTVTFDANEGTGTMSPQVANVPTALTPNAFTWTGYTFSGWNTASNGTGTAYADEAVYPFDADITLFAQWAHTYTITYDGNSNDSGSAPVDSFSPYVVGATVTVLDNTDLAKTNYVFAGWNTQADGLGTDYAPGETFSMPAANVTLYAKWTHKIYTLTLKSQPKYDGWVLESGEFTNEGGTKNNLGKILLLGDNAADKQYRDILSFGTAAIPDDAVITRVILKVKKAGLVGTNPMTTHNAMVVDVRKNKFYTLPVLQINDFQAKASKYKAGLFPTTLYSGWYRSVLRKGAYDYDYINKMGRTQLRLRFLLDDDDDNLADILKLYSGNAVLANRPKLIVKYYLP